VEECTPGVDEPAGVVLALPDPDEVEEDERTVQAVARGASKSERSTSFFMMRLDIARHMPSRKFSRIRDRRCAAPTKALSIAHSLESLPPLVRVNARRRSDAHSRIASQIRGG
jgi:hypothetical protein